MERLKILLFNILDKAKIEIQIIIFISENGDQQKHGKKTWKDLKLLLFIILDEAKIEIQIIKYMLSSTSHKYKENNNICLAAFGTGIKLKQN